MRRYFQAIGFVTAAMIGALLWTGAMRAQGQGAAVPPPLPNAAGAQAGGARGAAPPGSENGWNLFQTRGCARCHLNPTDKAPSGEMIREMAPERIYASLTSGSMQMQADALNDGQKR